MLPSFYSESVLKGTDEQNKAKGKCRAKNYWSFCDENPLVFNGSGVDTADPVYVDFAGSDSVFDDAEYAEVGDLQMYPAVAGAVVPIYNVPGLEELGHTLVLSKEVLASVFRKCTALPTCLPGSISSWSDPAILALNADAVSPTTGENISSNVTAALVSAGDITVVVRLDKSGTTEIWRAALSVFDESFALQVGEGSDNGDYAADVVKHDSNVGVAGHVAVTAGSIGYSVLGEATTVGLSFASLRESLDVEPVVASIVSVSNAVVERGLDFGASAVDQQRLVAFISDAQGSQAWPIVGYTYFVVRKSTLRPGATCANVEKTQAFFLWFYEDAVARGIAEELGFAPLTDTVRELVVARVKADMLCEGEPVFVSLENTDFRVTVGGASEAAATVFPQFELSYNVLNPDETFGAFASTTSSAAAVELVANGDASIAAVLASTPGLAQAVQDASLVAIPYVDVGLVAAYSFCGSDKLQPECDLVETAAPVVMTEELLARVLSKDIATWDHPDLVALNGAMPAESIVVVGFVDDAGDVSELQGRFEELVRAAVPGGSAMAGFSIMPDLVKSSLEGQRSALATVPYSIGFTPLIGDVDNLRDVELVTLRGVTPSANSVAECLASGSTTSGGAGPASASCYPLVDRLSLVARRAFAGVEECSGGSGTGTGERATLFLAFLLGRAFDSELAAAASLLAQNLVPLFSSAYLERLAESRPMPTPTSEVVGDLVDSITCDGVSIVSPEEQKNLIPKALVVVAFVLVGCSSVLFLFIATWVERFKQRTIVLIASPPFLQQMLLGAFVAMLAIVPLALQDDDFIVSSTTDAGANTLNAACMSAPFLYSIGFALLYSSLWLKTWRLGKIYNNPKLRRIHITNGRIKLYTLLQLLFVVGLNIVWGVVDPLRWERVILREDANGNVLESYGRCYSEQSLALVAPLAALLVASLVYGNYLVYLSRGVPSDFGEGRLIAFGLVTAFESLILGIPVLFLAGDNPVASFVVLLAIIVATTLVTALFIFVPKMYFVHTHPVGASTGLGSGSAGDSESFSPRTNSMESEERRERMRMSVTLFDSFREGAKSFVEDNDAKPRATDNDTV